jgi:hypothetical protein
MARTGVIRKIAIAATTATAPATPGDDAVVDWTGESDWTTFGSVTTHGDDYDLGGTSLSIPYRKERAMIDPPLAQTREDSVIVKNGADAWSFEVMDTTPEALAAIDTTATADGGDTTFGTSETKLSVIAETTNGQLYYFPSCSLDVNQVSGGIGAADPAVVQVNVTPYGTSTYPGGVVVY